MIVETGVCFVIGEAIGQDDIFVQSVWRLPIEKLDRARKHDYDV
jgi:hypothetical protein